ncbi:MAG: hypothetical protein Fur0018_16490 [Anaerolineales bacterium]
MNPLEKRAHLLICRLERISADSPWAHRAGGLKVALLRQVDALRQGQPAPALPALLEECHNLLSDAAREIPDPAAISPLRQP